MDAEKLIEGYTVYTNTEELAASAQDEAPATSPAVFTITVSAATWVEGC
ncbi:LxmA leader domain family RiPP [Streptomyces sp. NPDC051582]